MLAAAIPTKNSDGHDTGPRSLMYGTEGGAEPSPVPIFPVPARDGTTCGGDGDGGFPTPLLLLLGGGEESNLRRPGVGADDDNDDDGGGGGGVLTDREHNRPPNRAAVDVIVVLRSIMVGR